MDGRAHDETKLLLVVEDDEAVREMVVATLDAEAGLHAIGVRDGLDALNLLRSTEVDGLVVDYAVPRLDGLALIRRLRARPQTHRLPALLITGFGHALEAEMHEGEHLPVLAKPFRSAALIARVREMLDGSAPRTPASSGARDEFWGG